MARQGSKGKETTAVVSASDAKLSFRDMLSRAGHKDERIVITLYGREHAALIGMKDLERLRATDAA